MSRGGGMSKAQKEEAARLREEGGMSYGQIAERIGPPATLATVQYYCLIVGADPPGAKPIDPYPPGPLVVKRKGYEVRKFTPGDDQVLVGLDMLGLRLTTIGRFIGRRPNTIKARLAILARHDERRQTAGETRRTGT